MAAKDKRDSQTGPVLIKFGVALAVSLGGIVYTFLRSKRIMPFKPRPSLPSPGKGSQADSRGGNGEFGGDNRALENSINDLSSSNRPVVDSDCFLLPELDQLIKEYDLATNNVSSINKGQSLESGVESPNDHKNAEDEECNKQISSLRSKVKLLEEREKVLENQLLEYYGLKEHETAVMELQNRLRVHNMEAKLYNLKVESLQSDNERLQAQLADYEKVIEELESAQAKIKLLRKKLRFEAEKNKEQILSLQERVMKLQDQEKKSVGIDQDVEMELKKKKELEEELLEVKRYNQSLKIENSELAQKLENLQMLATSALDDEEVQLLKKESQNLRQQNEDLRMQIEQLQAGRCMEIEELVYFRWINACLRYELRNYQPGPDQTIARDLSRTLSPKSEEKAKKLILAYANKEGSRDKVTDTIDLDSDQWSSYLTDSGEPDDSPIDVKKNHPSKKRVFAKLMKLLKGKDNDSHNQTPPERAVSVEDIVSRCSSSSHSDDHHHIQTTRTSSGRSSSISLDLRRSCSRGQKSTTGESSNCSRKGGEDSTLSIFRRIDSNEDNQPPSLQPHEEAQSAAKTELVKYAEALKNSRVKSSFRRRSVDFGSF